MIIMDRMNNAVGLMLVFHRRSIHLHISTDPINFLTTGLE